MEVTSISRLFKLHVSLGCCSGTYELVPSLIRGSHTDQREIRLSMKYLEYRDAHGDTWCKSYSGIDTLRMIAGA